MTNSNPKLIQIQTQKRVCIMKNNDNSYLIFSDAAGARLRATATGLGDAMAAAYRLIG